MYAKDPYLDLAAHDDAGARSAAGTLLRTISRALDALAERLTPMRKPRLADPVLEFYADAGAPEGALYIDGQLVGHVAGVTRL
jgi:hypothetical protein